MTDGICAIVPVKPLDEGKSRLVGRLTLEARRRLNSHFLDRTLTLLDAFCGARSAIVTSRDPAVLARASVRGFVAMAEEGEGNLNDALAAATALARSGGARGVLILPVDLPLATVASLHMLCAVQPAVTLAGDSHGTGTNALFQAPSVLAGYSFGPGSLLRHEALARERGASVRRLQIPELALDIDTPEDLAAWSRAMPSDARLAMTGTTPDVIPST